MYKKKPFFITFEGIEGSGKSYQVKKLRANLKQKKIRALFTREPGGTTGAERIRKVILEDYFNKEKINKKFDKYTDTLLYLASRNEHIINKIKPALLNKNIVICDRFIDSTLAYQVYGKKVDIKFINFIHKYILNNIKPNLTFLLKVNLSIALKRLNKRKKKNRYDKFSKNFYAEVQNSFLKIAKKNKSRYLIIDNSKDSKDVEKIILKKVLSRIYK